MTTQNQKRVTQLKIKYMLFPLFPNTTDYNYTNTTADDYDYTAEMESIIMEITQLLKKYNSDKRLFPLIDEIRKLAQEEVKCITYTKLPSRLLIDVSRCSHITQFATSLFLFLKSPQEELEEVEYRVSTIDALLPLPILSRNSNDVNLSICAAMQCVEIIPTSVIPIVSDLAAIYLLHYHSHS